MTTAGTILAMVTALVILARVWPKLFDTEHDYGRDKRKDKDGVDKS